MEKLTKRLNEAIDRFLNFGKCQMIHIPGKQIYCYNLGGIGAARDNSCKAMVLA